MKLTANSIDQEILQNPLAEIDNSESYEKVADFITRALQSQDTKYKAFLEEFKKSSSFGPVMYRVFKKSYGLYIIDLWHINSNAKVAIKKAKEKGKTHQVDSSQEDQAFKDFLQKFKELVPEEEILTYLQFTNLQHEGSFDKSLEKLVSETSSVIRTTVELFIQIDLHSYHILEELKEEKPQEERIRQVSEVNIENAKSLLRLILKDPLKNQIFYSIRLQPDHIFDYKKTFDRQICERLETNMDAIKDGMYQENEQKSEKFHKKEIRKLAYELVYLLQFKNYCPKNQNQTYENPFEIFADPEFTIKDYKKHLEDSERVPDHESEKRYIDRDFDVLFLAIEKNNTSLVETKLSGCDNNDLRMLLIHTVKQGKQEITKVIIEEIIHRLKSNKRFDFAPIIENAKPAIFLMTCLGLIEHDHIVKMTNEDIEKILKKYTGPQDKLNILDFLYSKEVDLTHVNVFDIDIVNLPDDGLLLLKLIEYGLDVNYRCQVPSQNNTDIEYNLIAYVLALSCFDLAEKLIAHKNFNKKQLVGRMPLSLLVMQYATSDDKVKFLDQIKYLLSNGFDPNLAQTIKGLPLVYAIMVKDKTLINLLLENGAKFQNIPNLGSIIDEFTDDLDALQFLNDHYGYDPNSYGVGEYQRPACRDDQVDFDYLDPAKGNILHIYIDQARQFDKDNFLKLLDFCQGLDIPKPVAAPNNLTPLELLVKKLTTAQCIPLLEEISKKGIPFNKQKLLTAYFQNDAYDEDEFKQIAKICSGIASSGLVLHEAAKKVSAEQFKEILIILKANNIGFDINARDANNVTAPVVLLNVLLRNPNPLSYDDKIKFIDYLFTHHIADFNIQANNSDNSLGSHLVETIIIKHKNVAEAYIPEIMQLLKSKKLSPNINFKRQLLSHYILNAVKDKKHIDISELFAADIDVNLAGLDRNSLFACCNIISKFNEVTQNELAKLIKNKDINFDIVNSDGENIYSHFLWRAESQGANVGKAIIEKIVSDKNVDVIKLGKYLGSNQSNFLKYIEEIADIKSLLVSKRIKLDDPVGVDKTLATDLVYRAVKLGCENAYELLRTYPFDPTKILANGADCYFNFISGLKREDYSDRKSLTGPEISVLNLILKQPVKHDLNKEYSYNSKKTYLALFLLEQMNDKQENKKQYEAIIYTLLGSGIKLDFAMQGIETKFGKVKVDIQINFKDFLEVMAGEGTRKFADIFYVPPKDTLPQAKFFTATVKEFELKRDEVQKKIDQKHGKTEAKIGDDVDNEGANKKAADLMELSALSLKLEATQQNLGEAKARVFVSTNTDVDNEGANKKAADLMELSALSLNLEAMQQNLEKAKARVFVSTNTDVANKFSEAEFPLIFVGMFLVPGVFFVGIGGAGLIGLFAVENALAVVIVGAVVTGLAIFPAIAAIILGIGWWQKRSFEKDMFEASRSLNVTSLEGQVVELEKQKNSIEERLKPVELSVEITPVIQKTQEVSDDPTKEVNPDRAKDMKGEVKGVE